MRVFVLDKDKRPLASCHPARARILLKEGKASVYKMFPFTIILKESYPDFKPRVHCLKFDPGVSESGMVVVEKSRDKYSSVGRVVFASVIKHKFYLVRRRMISRALRRRFRRKRLRRRKARFYRAVSSNWISPSLSSVLSNYVTWINRIVALSPISEIFVEVSKFDSHKMKDKSVHGNLYRFGELYGVKDIRSYIFDKFKHRCVYCGSTSNLEIDHIIPKSRGGSDRIDNLVLACRKCNNEKGNRTASEFGYDNIQQLVGKSLKAPSVLNRLNIKLIEFLEFLGKPYYISDGITTSHNRKFLGLKKEHWIDALCVGEIYDKIIYPSYGLYIKAEGRGNRQIVRNDKYGFPRFHLSRNRHHFGFRSGDMVRTNDGIIGKVVCRSRGQFDVKTKNGTIYRKYTECEVIFKRDGYSYSHFMIANNLEV